MKKKFDLQKALAGTPVITRDGRKVIALHDYPVSGFFPVMAVIEGEETVESFARSGKYFYPDSKQSGLDLFLDVPMVEKKIYTTVWSGEGSGKLRRLPDGLSLGNCNFSTPEEALEISGVIAVATITYEVPK